VSVKDVLHANTKVKDLSQKEHKVAEYTKLLPFNFFLPKSLTILLHIYMQQETMLRLLVVLVLVHHGQALYTCVCNYNLELSVYSAVGY